MSDLIDTTEMYLRTIYELVEEDIPPLRARIVERLGHSGPTVSQTVARMERDGLLHVEGDRHIVLSAHGRVLAARVMRKHRLAECLLTEVLGLDWSLVHDEACRWEHVMSEAVEQRIVAMLDGPQVSPYGNPIPALDELGAPAAPALSGVTLARVLADAAGPVEVVVARLSELAQSDPGLPARLRDVGVRPGAHVGAELTAGGLELSTGAGRLVVEHDLATHLFVAAG